MKLSSLANRVMLIAASLSIAALASPDGTVTKSVPASRGGSLEVYIESGDISVTGWDKNEVSVVASGLEEEDGKNLSITQQQNAVRVEFHPSWGGSSGTRFDIKVPSEFDIDLKTSGGNIEVLGPLSGTLQGKTAGGSIHLGDLGGTVEMVTSGGNILSGNIRGNVTLRTSGGDVQVGSVTGEANLVTSGGKIEVKDVGKQLKASTSGGNISAGNVGAQATLSSSGGDIVVGSVSSSASLATAGGDIDLRSADGDAKVRSAGGDLRLGKISGSVDASTAGGDILDSLSTGVSGKGKLSSAGGNIRLVVPEGARATIKARIRVTHGQESPENEYDIRSDFPTEGYEKDERAHEIRATVQLNGGGPILSVETTMGNIEIRKAR